MFMTITYSNYDMETKQYAIYDTETNKYTIKTYKETIKKIIT